MPLGKGVRIYNGRFLAQLEMKIALTMTALGLTITLRPRAGGELYGAK